MICPYCQNPILEGQKTRLRIDKETEDIKRYHKACYEMYLNELIDKVREDKGDRACQHDWKHYPLKPGGFIKCTKCGLRR